MLYTGIFFLLSMAVNYIVSAVSYATIMSSRRMGKKFLAYIPVINGCVVPGMIFDDISRDYKQKTRRGFLLLMLVIALIVAFIYYIFLVNSLMPGVAELFTNGTLSAKVYSDKLESLSDLNANLLFISTLIVLITSFIFLIYYFKTFMGIFKEYFPQRAGAYIIIAILAIIFFNIQFILPLLVYTIRKKTPQFLILNSKTSYYRE